MVSHLPLQGLVQWRSQCCSVAYLSARQPRPFITWCWGLHDSFCHRSARGSRGDATHGGDACPRQLSSDHLRRSQPRRPARDGRWRAQEFCGEGVWSVQSDRGALLACNRKYHEDNTVVVASVDRCLGSLGRLRSMRRHASRPIDLTGEFRPAQCTPGLPVLTSVGQSARRRALVFEQADAVPRPRAPEGHGTTS